MKNKYKFSTVYPKRFLHGIFVRIISVFEVISLIGNKLTI